MTTARIFATAILIFATAPVSGFAQTDNVAPGERVFRACVACHSLEADKNMTGPSLSGLWKRKAGSLASFSRYSSALKSAGIVWNEKTLDDYLRDPQRAIPGNTMTFSGIKDARQRADLLTFLQDATQPGRAQARAQGPMGRMTGAGAVPKLKALEPKDRVRAITHCGDSYKVATTDGKTHDFWERNLRFKTDVSEDGPQKGAPALVPAGMMGDRADVIFSAPEEISAFISAKC